MKTKIAWTDESWNPIGLEGGGHGCAKVSPGCDHCYAEAISRRFWKTPPYDGRKREYKIKRSIVYPCSWKKPRRIFVCSMMDLFHHDVSDDMIEQVLEVMKVCDWHIFQILTKRSERMHDFFDQRKVPANVWLGITIENEKTLHFRQRYLYWTSAKIIWASVEPLLGPINNLSPLFHWVVIGCESGPQRRPCKIEWVRDIVQHCQYCDIPVFVKQLNIDGRVSHDMNEWPEDLWVREFPKGE